MHTDVGRGSAIEKLKKGETSRSIAVRILSTVLAKGRSLDNAMLNTDIPQDVRPLVQELVTGCVRHYYSLTEAVDAHLHKPLRRKDIDISCVLLVGAYQLAHTRIPPYAAVDEMVNCTRLRGKPWAAKLVNAVLRELRRNPWQSRSEEAVYDHPQWFIDILRKYYPDQYPELLGANNSRAPMCLRINPRVTTLTDYGESLRKADIAFRAGVSDHALVLEHPVPVSTLPGFSDGLVSVQDQGAQFASLLVGSSPCDRVLDACAAPGGKAFDLLERHPDIHLTTLEKDSVRLDRIRTEGSRLGFLPENMLCADATNLDWWDGKHYDRVLLDAPCSGSGTVRRHPDIKLLKHRRDICAYHKLQLRLLQSLWHTLKAGGSLLYCTCSIFPEENDRVIQEFLEGIDAACFTLETIDLDWGVQTTVGWQMLPQVGGADGFYFARIRKAV